MQHQYVMIIDFGGQYNQLIARRVRECGVYCEVTPYGKVTPELIKEKNPVGIIFTGGPSSVYDVSSPHIDRQVFELGIPVLGICYGAQLMAYTLGGKAATAPTSEYGKTQTEFDNSSAMFKGLPQKAVTWMSQDRKSVV